NVTDNTLIASVNNQLAGEQAGQPMYQGRVGWTAKKPANPRTDPLQIGLWGMTGADQFSRPIGGHTRLEMNVGGLDVVVPLAPRFSLRGEWWSGNNLADVRGGIGQGINDLGHEVHSHGGWSELTINARGRWASSVGYSEDAPRRSDLTLVTNRLFNR